MRNLKLILIAVMLLSVTNVTATVLLTQFTIQNTYLQDNKLKPNPNGATNFIVDFNFSKSGATYNTVKMTVVYSEDYINYTTISSPKWKYDGDWSSSVPLWQDTVAVTLPAGLKAGKIFMRYIVYNGNNPGAETTSNTYYEIYKPIVVDPSDPSTRPLLSAAYEGRLLQLDNIGTVYSVMEGVLRHVQTPATLNGVYKVSGIIHHADLPYGRVGNPIQPNAHILQNVNDGKIYFAEGNYIRHITSPAVAEKYSFRISSNPNIFIANGVSGYTIGPPLQ